MSRSLRLYSVSRLCSLTSMNRCWELSTVWPLRRATAGIRARIKEIVAPRGRLKEPIGVIVEELKRVLQGWCNYFRWDSSSRQFSRIDSYARERLALFDSKKRQKPGRRLGRGTRRHRLPDWASSPSLGQAAMSAPRQRPLEHHRRAVLGKTERTVRLPASARR